MGPFIGGKRVSKTDMGEKSTRCTKGSTRAPYVAWKRGLENLVLGFLKPSGRKCVFDSPLTICFFTRWCPLRGVKKGGGQWGKGGGKPLRYTIGHQRDQIGLEIKPTKGGKE